MTGVSQATLDISLAARPCRRASTRRWVEAAYACQAASASAPPKLMWGWTTIVVAHHMAAICDADIIHVLDNGKVVEPGSHDDLILDPNLYARLHDLQIRSESDSEVILRQ
jgi:hypothetical protein